MKNKLAIIGIILIFAAGLGVLSYPLISSAVNNFAARSQAEEYTKTVKLMPTERQQELLKSAQKYNDSLTQKMFNLVEAVNTRSLHQDDVNSYAMKWDTYKSYTKSTWETYIMQERLRELCFEGKRWYDLLRYNYRHIDGVQYNRTLGEIAGDADNASVALPAIYDDMLALATRGRHSEAQAIKAKMRNEAYLYLPIPDADINVCPLLRQNPAYKSGNAYEKNY